jgi:hypothetical protein
VVPEIVPVRSGAVNDTAKCVLPCPDPGLTLIRAFLALVVLPGAVGLVVDWVELVCGEVDPESDDPALEAAEQAGSAAIPSTTSEATTFGLIDREFTPAHGILTLDTFSFSQGD